MPPLKKKKAGSKGKKAELLYKKWLESQGYLCHKAAPGSLIRIGRKTFCRSHDIFGCIDVLGINSSRSPCTIAAQITTQAGRSARKAKIEAITKWPISWSVVLVTHEKVKEDTKTVNRWKIEQYVGTEWSDIYYEEFDPKEL